MAESDSILQLGIEAARDGNREEARNLFRLLTRQDAGNAQAWLWLAGVAENRDERQGALERVVELDPSNEMAVKGLQALGVRPTVRLREEAEDIAPTMPIPVAVPLVDPQPVAASGRGRYDVDDDDPFAALDTLSDAMAESPTAVRRADPSPDEFDSLDDLSDTMNAETSRPVRRTAPVRSAADEEERRRVRASTTTTRRRPTKSTYGDDDTVPARRGVSPLLMGLVGFAVLLLLGLFLWNTFLRDDETIGRGPGGIGTEQTSDPAQASGTPAIGTSGEGVAPGLDLTATAASGAGVVDPAAVAGATAVPGVDPAAPTADPAAPVVDPAAPVVDPAAGAPDPAAAAAPALVAPNTPLESNGWLYDFSNPGYASPIIGGLGNFQPEQGRFVVVLAFIANRSGSDQSLPSDFFVLKDAQGRVYNPRPDVSGAYVQRGINADLSQQDAVPADGLTRSVALIFDVAPDATDLVFFARSKSDQGWQVLSRVQ